MTAPIIPIKGKSSPAKGATAAARKARTDWQAVERDYRTGKFTLRELGAKHDCDRGLISRNAKRHGWTKLVDPTQFFTESTRADDFTKPGFVYVISMTDTAGVAFHKIGMAVSLEQRLKSHQCSSPFDLTVAIGYFVGNMVREEAALHGLLSGKRVRGEWFKLSSDDLNNIAMRARLV